MTEGGEEEWYNNRNDSMFSPLYWYLAKLLGETCEWQAVTLTLTYYKPSNTIKIIPTEVMNGRVIRLMNTVRSWSLCTLKFDRK